MKNCWWFLTSVFLFLITLTQIASAAGGYVALQTADPSCPDDSGNVYVDCGNGTVTDNRTGLVWLKNANCLSLAANGGYADWISAMLLAAGLSDLPGDDADDCGLSDNSTPGEWRLPSKAEWAAMIEDALGDIGDPNCTITPPTITNDSGLGCWLSGPSSFTDVEEGFYWSSTTFVWFPSGIWGVSLESGTFGNNHKDSELGYIWPVRGGQ